MSIVSSIAPHLPRKDVESEVYERFARRVGWILRDDALLKNDALIFNPREGEGHIPIAYAKLGVPESCRSDHLT